MTAPSTLSKTEPACVPSNRPRKKRILFASVHSVLDFSNGASVATLDILQGLATLGFECQAFCTAKLDIHDEVSFEKMIGDRRLRGVSLGGFAVSALVLAASRCQPGGFAVSAASRCQPWRLRGVGGFAVSALVFGFLG